MKRHLPFFVLTILLLTFGNLAAQPAHFRFAWLSDTHVGSTTGAIDLSLAVHDINTLPDIDFVIISGDITETGKASDLRLTKALLDSLNKPYHIIPGNHDTKWTDNGFTTFAQLWSSDKFVFEYGGIRFIGLHQGPLMRMGDGHFAPEDLRWLDGVLDALPDKQQPLIFVLHYPADPSIDNWYALLDRAKRYNTQAILCGHGHRNRVLDFEGTPGVMGRSSLRAKASVGGYTIATVRDDSVFFAERAPGSATGPNWHRLALGRRSVQADTTRLLRPDFAINQKFPTVREKWTLATDYTITAAPAVAGDKVVAANRAGMVYCLSAQNGKIRWQFDAGAPVYSTPAIAEGRVVFGAVDGNISCLQLKDGKLLWQVQTPAAVVAAPRIDAGTVFIGGGDGRFRAIDLRSGKRIWRFDEVGDFVETRAVVYGDKVFFGAWDTYFYALDRRDGSLAWKWSSGNPGVLYSPAACWPVAAAGKVFIVAPDRYMTAIDAASGQTVWRTHRHQVRETIGISADGRTVFARCMTDTLLAFTTDRTDTSASGNLEPTLRWATVCGYGYDIDPSMPLEKAGVIYFGTKNGLVFAVDARTGAVKWQHRVGVTVVNTVAPVDAHRVAITDFDGRIMLLESR